MQRIAPKPMNLCGKICQKKRRRKAGKKSNEEGSIGSRKLKRLIKYKEKEKLRKSHANGLKGR